VIVTPISIVISMAIPVMAIVVLVTIITAIAAIVLPGPRITGSGKHEDSKCCCHQRQYLNLPNCSHGHYLLRSLNALDSTASWPGKDWLLGFPSPSRFPIRPEKRMDHLILIGYNNRPKLFDVF